MEADYSLTSYCCGDGDGKGCLGTSVRVNSIEILRSQTWVQQNDGVIHIGSFQQLHICPLLSL